MSEIEHVVGREVLDSRGNPTVEVEVVLATGARGGRSCPRGRRPASTRRSSGATAATASAARASRPRSATSTARSRDAVLDLEALDQRGIDTTLIDLDGTANKARLGANAILGVSLAVGEGRRRRARAPAVPVRRRRERARAARADDERPQRRRARRQQRGLPRVHGHADRRGRRIARRCAGASRRTTR